MLEQQGPAVLAFLFGYLSRGLQAHELFRNTLDELRASLGPEAEFSITDAAAPREDEIPDAILNPAPTPVAAAAAPEVKAPTAEANATERIIHAVFAQNSEYPHPTDQVLLDPKALSAVDELFNLLDVDESGFVEMDELTAVHPGHDAADLFGHVDANSDGLISLNEFRMFFSHLSHAKGSNSVQLLVAYFTMNAAAAANEEPITVLPVTELLLDNFGLLKPPAVLSLAAEIDEAQRQRAEELFGFADEAQLGCVAKSEFAAVWGGDSIGLFGSLEAKADGTVDLAGWLHFFAQMMQHQGAAVVAFALQYFERVAAIQLYMKETTDPHN